MSEPNEKSAADLLIEQIAEKELAKQINPLAVTSVEEIAPKKGDGDVRVAKRVNFANGAVVSTYA